MSREIKFRAWDENGKHMLEWNTIIQTAYNRDRITLLYDVLTGTRENFTVMQYTGLKDRNGKEIYEGDVVHCAILNADGSGFIRDFTATVEEDICNPCFVLKQEDGRVEYDFVMCGLMILEIIGNIYEEVNTNENKSSIQHHTDEQQEEKEADKG